MTKDAFDSPGCIRPVINTTCLLYYGFRYFRSIEICHIHSHWYRYCVRGELLHCLDKEWEIFEVELEESTHLDIKLVKIWG